MKRMDTTITADSVYIPSEDVVTRVIEGEILLVPISRGIGDLDDIYSLNETGRAIWESLDGKKSLIQVAQALSNQYSAPLEEIENDVRGFIGEMLRRKMITDARTSRTSA